MDRKHHPPDWLGILNVHKPSGISSREAVNCVQRQVAPAKIGHAGTLDPIASGVLIVCVGKATRLIEHLQRGTKSYRARFALGRKSDTEDIEGEVELLDSPPIPTIQQLEAALPRFLGTISQRPPSFSAIKVKGQRAYHLARRGDLVTLAARPVEIHALTTIEYAYPDWTVEITCGSGTYVRSLGRDIAQSLGTEAIMTALVRTAVGPFRLDDAVSLEQLERDSVAAHLLQPEVAFPEMPRLPLDHDACERFAVGMTVDSPSVPIGSEWTAFDPAGRCVGLARQVEDRQARACVNFIARN
jgi:tRNA pseudouridine55 synthase